MFLKAVVLSICTLSVSLYSMEERESKLEIIIERNNLRSDAIDKFFEQRIKYSNDPLKKNRRRTKLNCRHVIVHGKLIDNTSKVPAAKL